MASVSRQGLPEFKLIRTSWAEIRWPENVGRVNHRSRIMDEPKRNINGLNGGLF